MVTLGRVLASLLRSWWWLVLLLFAWDLYVRLKGFNVIVLPDPWTVARALANRPRLVLADEPSGNLDSEQSRQLHDLLLELNRTDHQTFVLVTHNEQLAAQTGRRLRMADGVLKPV